MTIQFPAVFRPVPERFIAFVEELPDANTQGATIEEARENTEEAVAVALVLAANRELSEPQLRGVDVIREPLRLRWVPDGYLMGTWYHAHATPRVLPYLGVGETTSLELRRVKSAISVMPGTY